MGSGIATALILSNYSVVLKEVNEKFLQSGLDRVKGEVITSFVVITCIQIFWSNLNNFICTQLICKAESRKEE